MCFFLKYVVDIKCNCFSISLFLTENMFHACRKVISVVNIVKLNIKKHFFI